MGEEKEERSYQVVDKGYELDVVLLRIGPVVQGESLQRLVDSIRLLAHAKEDVGHNEALLDAVLLHLFEDLREVLEVLVLREVRGESSISQLNQLYRCTPNPSYFSPSPRPRPSLLLLLFCIRYVISFGRIFSSFIISKISNASADFPLLQ